MCGGISVVILSCLICRRTLIDPRRRLKSFYCLAVNLVVCSIYNTKIDRGFVHGQVVCLALLLQMFPCTFP